MALHLFASSDLDGESISSYRSSTERGCTTTRTSLMISGTSYDNRK